MNVNVLLKYLLSNKVLHATFNLNFSSTFYLIPIHLNLILLDVSLDKGCNICDILDHMFK